MSYYVILCHIFFEKFYKKGLQFIKNGVYYIVDKERTVLSNITAQQGKKERVTL